MKLSYDAECDLLCLVLGDNTVHQTYRGLGKDILAGYGDDGRLVSLLIFKVKDSLSSGERLKDFVMTLKTETELVGVEVPDETMARLRSRINEALGVTPAEGAPAGQSRP
ncbi:MAG: hypothetical protein EXR51_02710 [Dehalococcoidia bacterium]|nr:hypothetical protein [Dehalococcoidia bacterium]